MKCGIRFCGGCNPRYNRRAAYEEIKGSFDNIEFSNAVVEDVYDCLLVLGGCSNCCASYEQFNNKGDVFKMWEEEHIENIKAKLSAI